MLLNVCMLAIRSSKGTGDDCACDFPITKHLDSDLDDVMVRALVSLALVYI